MKRSPEGIQYGLRGLDPFTGKNIPYEAETLDGNIGVRTQRLIDTQIEFEHIKKISRQHSSKTLQLSHENDSQ